MTGSLQGIESARIAGGFERWLDAVLPELTSTNSFDIHMDELLGKGAGPQEWLDGALNLFTFAVTELRTKLRGKVAMLMIPLRSSKGLETSVPGWQMLANQLSSTPPSIYVMEPAAYLQAWRADRYLSPAEIPAQATQRLRACYCCWRNIDDPVEEGWARDIRVECYVAPDP